MASYDWPSNIISGTITGTGTSGQVAYFNGTNTITSDSAFLWDGTRLAATRIAVGTGTADATSILAVRKDQVATTRILVTNGTANASAAAEVKMTAFDDFLIGANGNAAGGVYINSGSGFTGGIVMHQSGANPITFKNNSINSLVLSSANIGLFATGLGVGVSGNVDANTIFEVRKDQNAATRQLISNGDAGASAVAALRFSTSAGDSNFQALSTAAGASMSWITDSTYTGGLTISMLGTNPIVFKNNGTTALTLDGSRRVGIGSSGADAGTSLLVSLSTTLTGTSQQSVYALPSFNSAATTQGCGFYSQPGTAASAFTMARLYSYYADIGTLGATSSVTRFANFGGAQVATTASLAATAFLTDSTSFPAGAWSIYLTSTNDSLISGNFKLNTAGKGLYIKEGSNATMGTLTANGITEVTVNTTAVTANSRIFLTIQVPGGTPGAPYISSRVAGTSFGVKSLAADTSTIAWMIVEPA